MERRGHHPPHLYLDNTWYMITSGVCGGQRILRLPGHKELVRDVLRELVVEFGLALSAWVILDNHSHILVKSKMGGDLRQFVARWHGRTSHDLNGLDDARGRQVWHNYWDACVRAEADYWKRFNYIHHNPVKHGYVASMEQWACSSYGYYRRQKGDVWLADVFERYPVVDFSDVHDSFLTG